MKSTHLCLTMQAVGTGGIAFTIVVMAIRCFDGTYDVSRSGKYLDVSHAVFSIS
jgi:hypothetical protein